MKMAIGEKCTAVKNIYPWCYSDRIIAVFRSGESELFDFEIGGEVQLKEGDEPNPANAHLYLVDNEK